MGEEDVKLLGSWYSPYVARVVWALKLKGVEYEYVEEDLRNKSPLLLGSNPILKKVPVLIHDGKPILESLNIVEYIDETWKEEPILPDDPYKRSTARFWAMFAEENCWDPVKTAYWWEGEKQAKAIAATQEGLKFLEEEVKGKKFFGGEKIGLVDISMGWMAHWLVSLEEAAGVKIVDRDNFPNLSTWLENFAAHPLIKDNLPDQHQLTEFFKVFKEFVSAVSASK